MALYIGQPFLVSRLGLPLLDERRENSWAACRGAGVIEFYGFPFSNFWWGCGRSHRPFSEVTLALSNLALCRSAYAAKLDFSTFFPSPQTICKTIVDSALKERSILSCFCGLLLLPIFQYITANSTRHSWYIS